MTVQTKATYVYNMFGKNYTDFHELGAASVWEILVPPAVAMIFVLTGTVVKSAVLCLNEPQYKIESQYAIVRVVNT